MGLALKFFLLTLGIIVIPILLFFLVIGAVLSIATLLCFLNNPREAETHED